MAVTKVIYREVRFVLGGDGCTCPLHMYAFIECEDTFLQGWYHKAFPAGANIQSVMTAWKEDPNFENPMLWPKETPKTYKELD